MRPCESFSCLPTLFHTMSRWNLLNFTVRLRPTSCRSMWTTEYPGFEVNSAMPSLPFFSMSSQYSRPTRWPCLNIHLCITSIKVKLRDVYHFVSCAYYNSLVGWICTSACCWQGGKELTLPMHCEPQLLPNRCCSVDLQPFVYLIRLFHEIKRYWLQFHSAHVPYSLDV